MKNILFYGDYDCTTGFGNVSKELVNEFSKEKDFFITVFATNNHAKEPYNTAENIYVIPALSTREKGDTDLYSRKSLLKLLYNGSYSIVFCLNDIEVINQLDEHLRYVKNLRKKENKKSFKSLLYFPIDSEVRKQDLKVLSFLDEAVTYTDYGKSEVKRLIGTSASYKKLKVIPHAVSENYHKIKDFKSKLNNNKDSFLFGSINRNSVRKDYGTLLIAFSELKKQDDYKNCQLYLHCNPLDPFGINLYRLSQRLGLEVDKDIIFPEDFNENKGISESELNNIYNSFDCFITTTTAEGWGLTVHEAMMCETLVICPLHTSLTEVTNNGKVVLPIKKTSTTVYKDDLEKIRYKSDTDSVIDAMKLAFNMNSSDKAQKILEAKKFASKFKWKKTAEMFKKLIRKQIG
jgi:glycosyltransferase involved in cell wall biosynthesis|tara:strand:+ start:5774 stop:6985 length:1212 start_codon:yes stop_codon:yes gene_type:complete